MTAINALKTIKSRIIYWSKFFSSKVNSLHVVVGSLLLGAVVLVVGLVQLAPGAEAAQNSTALIVVGCSLLVVGVFLAPLRALCIKRQKAAQKDGTHQRSVTSIDMLLAQHRWERRCQLFICFCKIENHRTTRMFFSRLFPLQISKSRNDSMLYTFDPLYFDWIIHMFLFDYFWSFIENKNIFV